jgi:UDP-N-acetylglucosamine--N-acetylmuramyl-(pentapeptide) pyrophosphoryl-undecaprenol N-acetylglucosamine transferase
VTDGGESGKEATLKVAVACGGTGGHVFPGLATAQELRRRGHATTLYLGGRTVEQYALGDWDGPVARIPSEGFAAGVSWRALRTVFRLWRARRLCLAAMAANPPDLVLAMGGYACVGPALAGKRLGARLILHEANAVAGRAIAWLARYAHTVALTFDECGGLPHVRTLRVGLPLRAALADDRAPPTAADAPDFDAADARTVLVMGGSQGAHWLNEIAPAALTLLRDQGLPVQALHLAGTADSAAVRASYRQGGVPARVFPFLREMGWAYRQAHVAVARAGASSCMELARFQVPALLTPLPSAARDHQTANARAMQRLGAAEMAAQCDLSPARLAKRLAVLADDNTRTRAMRQALTTLHVGDAAARLADLVEACA